MRAESNLLNEFNWAASRADQMVTRINKRLNENSRTPPEFSLLELLASQSALRNHVEMAKHAAARLRAPASADEEQRSQDAFIIRKATLAIQLLVARLARILEALL